MAQTFTGTVILVENTKLVGKNGFKKRRIILSDKAEKYPNTLPFEYHGDGCDLLDGIQIGEQVTVTYEVRGRVWHSPKTDSDMYFVTLEAWKIHKGADAPSEPEPESTAEGDPEEEMPF